MVVIKGEGLYLPPGAASPSDGGTGDQTPQGG